MAKQTKKATRATGSLLGRLLTWPWRRLPWHGKLILIPAMAAMLVYGGVWLAGVLFGIH